MAASLAQAGLSLQVCTSGGKGASEGEREGPVARDRNALRAASEFARVRFSSVAAGHTSDPFDAV